MTKKQDVIPNGATTLRETKGWRNEESQLQARGILCLTLPLLQEKESEDEVMIQEKELEDEA